MLAMWPDNWAINHNGLNHCAFVLASLHIRCADGSMQLGVAGGRSGAPSHSMYRNQTHRNGSVEPEPGPQTKICNTDRTAKQAGKQEFSCGDEARTQAGVNEKTTR